MIRFKLISQMLSARRLCGNYWGRNMFRSVRAIMVIAAVLLCGCVRDPDSMPTYRMDPQRGDDKAPSSIITSVVSQDTLNKLGVPVDSFWGWKDAHPPTAINGKGSLQFAKTFAGLPIDGNFQVEVPAGVQRVSFHHFNGNAEVREYLVEFNAEPNHKYYAKFLTPRNDPVSYTHLTLPTTPYV